MRKFLLTALLFLIIGLPAECAPLQANISKEGEAGINRIVDSETNAPIAGARVSLPQKNYSTISGADGTFDLNANINGSTILSVEKEGYKPFSLTVNEQIASRPIVVGIEKTNPYSTTIEKDMFHLGDSMYSDMSANAGQFRVKCIGPFYTKNIRIDNISNNVYLVIGSIIGIDTKMAKSMGQNNIVHAYSSPPEIFFNGNKIAEIQLNGDGQRFQIPKNLIRLHQNNEITLKTGRNLMQLSYIDYDDIEFMNLYIENK